MSVPAHPGRMPPDACGPGILLRALRERRGRQVTHPYWQDEATVRRHRGVHSRTLLTRSNGGRTISFEGRVIAGGWARPSGLQPRGQRGWGVCGVFGRCRGVGVGGWSCHRDSGTGRHAVARRMAVAHGHHALRERAEGGGRRAPDHGLCADYAGSPCHPRPQACARARCGPATASAP